MRCCRNHRLVVILVVIWMVLNLAGAAPCQTGSNISTADSVDDCFFCECYVETTDASTLVRIEDDVASDLVPAQAPAAPDRVPSFPPPRAS